MKKKQREKVQRKENKTMENSKMKEREHVFKMMPIFLFETMFIK